MNDGPPRTAMGFPLKNYRPDIDGLRAVAVIAVILTHADVPGFSGGFVGVDIFFVISGYLITRDLFARQREGRLSLLAFYVRRMRRTLPALYLVSFFVLMASALTLMPGSFDEMARSLIGVVALVPNVVFLMQAGYFDPAALAKPLLHTWSLGVEEQFYLLVPILPLALRVLTERARRVALGLLCAAALVGAIALRHLAPDAAFYLMPARLFEFLIGGLVAEGLVPPLRSRWSAEAVSAAAFVALGVAITTFSWATSHPGLPTLLPCVATAALIHAGLTHRTFVGTMLSLRVASFIGLISYSLYLWHWPILVLARSAEIPQTGAVLALEAGLLLVLSVLTWRFVETPFRNPASVWRLRAPWLVPGGAALLTGCATAVVLANGFPNRFPPAIASLAAYYAYRDQMPFRKGQCFITSKEQLSDFDRATCLKLAPDRPNVLLVGDSHAAHLWTGLRDTWPQVNFLQATASGCKPTLAPTGEARCTTLMRDMFEHFIPDHRLDAVIIAGLWDDGDIVPLERAIAVLKTHVGRVLVFGPMPRYDEPIATLLPKSLLHDTLDSVPTHLLPSVKPLDAAMRAAIAPLATYVSTYDAMCPRDRCRLFAAEGVPMQFDYHHLTKQGADRMMATIRDQDGPLF